jgi:Tfp pilus assembly protein PilZ
MQEKRKANRLAASEETFLSKSDGEKTGVKLIDISLGGMRVLMNEELLIGSTLLGQFKILPHSGPFYIKGEVAWSKPCREKDPSYKFEIGIKFAKINTVPI